VPQITLMEGLKWSQMVLRRATESTPMLRNSKLELAKGEKIVIGMVLHVIPVLHRSLKAYLIELLACCLSQLP
jgi:hypothetical protein